MPDGPTPLELHCLGVPNVLLNGGAPPAEVLWRKNIALLAYLALTPDRSRSREHLIGVLWPELDQAHARRAFNESLRRLKSSLGTGRLETDREAVTLNDKNLWVDAIALLDQDDGLDVAHLGEFLEGLVVPDAPEFENWMSLQRSKLRDHLVRWLVATGQEALFSGDLATATANAERALEMDALSDAAIILQMKAAALGGDTAHALKVCDEFEKRLERELGYALARTVTALRDRIASGAWTASHRPTSDRDIPLVGRRQQHRQIFEVAESRFADGGIFIRVSGETGSGHSRIIAEVMERAQLNGTLTVLAQPLEGDADLHYSTLRVLLQGLSDAPGRTGAAPEHLSLLSRLEPWLTESGGPDGPLDPGPISTAFAAMLEAITEEQPLLMAIDDAQWCDSVTLRVLRVAFSAIPRSPIGLVMTCGAHQHDGCSELLRLESQLGRRSTALSLELTPLGIEDIRELVDRMAPWCDGDEQRDRLSRRLNFETNGNPLLLSTLLRSLNDAASFRGDLLEWPVPQSTLAGPLPIEVPEVMSAAIQLRMLDLSPDGRRTLKAASLGGPEMRLELLSQVSELEGPDLEKAVSELERAEFLRLVEDRLVFSAPLIGEIIKLSCMGRSERKLLRDRVIASLEERADLVSTLSRAQALAEAGRKEEAFGLALEVARGALHLGTSHAAHRSLDLATRISAETAESDLDPELTELRRRLRESEEAEKTR